ncbi:major facilitator superfamily domain-containing protein [Macrophomina phaseolina]|uniref:Major facilitator superfamily domain-containing protein n=1 Tax=Macrophomina phaseolina TaxID=35725 RepID=A0ABQ8GAC8_9PEZI|nr:major facilitator superfamily domain-containing protein [Macrophomina phaseolina]
MKEDESIAVAGDVEDNVDIDGAKEPEGGLHAWLTVVGSALVYFASFGFMNSFGYFQDFYQLHYLVDYSPSTIAFIGTLQISLMYVVGPVAGALFDSYGLKWLYPVAALGCCGSLIGLSFSESGAIWQQFLSQGVLFGLTVAFGVQPALAAAGQHFKRRRALAMGVVAGGSSIGGVCLPIMFSRIVPKIGFGWSVRVAALIFLCCYLAAICISRTKHRPVKPQKTLGGNLLDFNGFKDPRYLILAIGSFVASLGLYVPYYYVESYMTLRHPSASIHSYLLPLINGASFFGRIIGGFLADRTGRLNLLYPMTIVSGVFCLAMWLPSQNVATVIAFVCMYGFSSGIFISVTPAVVAQISPDEKIGARIGAFFTLAAIATLIGTPVAGSLIHEDSQDGYTNLILFAVSCQKPIMPFLQAD